MKKFLFYFCTRNIDPKDTQACKSLSKIKDIDIFEDLFFRKDINIDFNFSKYKKISSNIISFKYYCKIIFEKLLQIQNNDDYKKILKLSEY